MEFQSSYETLWHLAIAIGLGLLIGLERERAGKEAGLRTFSFTSLLGYLSWNQGIVYAIGVLAFVALVVIVINVSALRKGNGIEATTSICLMLVAFVGMLVAQGALFPSVTVIIFVLLLLSWKDEMVLFTSNLQKNELHAAITLGLLAFVIYPVLPEGAVDPWGLLLPRKIWLMVVLISAIGFANYILLRIYGAKGTTYTGILGGLVNSTATAAGLADKARGREEILGTPAFRGIIWAKSSAFVRNGIILGLFAPAALPAGLLPVALMILANTFFLIWARKEAEVEAPVIQLESPFSLRSALSFGAMFGIITVVGALAEQFAGNFGFYAISFAGGIVSSSSTAATAAHLVAEGKITPHVAGSGVVLSSISSVLVILPVVWRSAPKSRLARRIAWSTVWLIIAAIIGLIANPYFLRQYDFVETLLNVAR